nr:3-oxoacyl-[acyl-carrier-protein] synthase III C-terminal domain-containing protein [Nitrosomonas nitrosa]
MSIALDCINFVAFDPNGKWTHVSNAEYLRRLERTIWDSLVPSQKELYGKLLASERGRYVSLDMLNLDPQSTYKARYEAYKSTLVETVRQCVQSLVDEQPATKQLRLIITNQTVGGICPPPSSVVANCLDAPDGVECIDLGYMGCSAAIWGAELAARLLKPSETAIILSAELTSLMTNFSGGNECLPANCVFGDGAGAFLVAKPPHRYKSLFRIKDFSGSVISTDTALECVRYEASDVYHEIRIMESLPSVAMEGIKKAVRPMVERSFVSWDEKLRYALFGRLPNWQRKVDYAVLHTAGNKILKGVQAGLGLSDDQVGHNFETFKKFGNTSSASVYYSLKQLWGSGRLSRGNTILFVTYGSGFMTKAMYATVE